MYASANIDRRLTGTQYNVLFVVWYWMYDRSTNEVLHEILWSSGMKKTITWMFFLPQFWRHLIDLQSAICDGNDIQNAASQLNETLVARAFKVLIEKFNEQSSDVSPMFSY